MVIAAALLLGAIIHLVAIVLFGASMDTWVWWVVGMVIAGAVGALTDPAAT